MMLHVPQVSAPNQHLKGVTHQHVGNYQQRCTHHCWAMETRVPNHHQNAVALDVMANVHSMIGQPLSSQALLRSQARPEAGAWLTAIPIEASAASPPAPTPATLPAHVRPSVPWHVSRLCSSHPNFRTPVPSSDLRASPGWLARAGASERMPNTASSHVCLR